MSGRNTVGPSSGSWSTPGRTSRCSRSCERLARLRPQNEKGRVFGIDGEGVVVYASRITLRIGNTTEKVRCVFSDRDDIPFILGRLDLLKRHDMLFLKDAFASGRGRPPVVGLQACRLQLRRSIFQLARPAADRFPDIFHIHLGTAGRFPKSLLFMFVAPFRLLSKGL